MYLFMHRTMLCIPVKSERRWQKDLIVLCFSSVLDIRCYKWEYFCLGSGSSLDSCHLRSLLLYIFITSIWVIPTQYCSRSVFQPCKKTMQALNNIASSLLRAHWQTSLLSHSQRRLLQRLVATFSWANALGPRPMRSLALHKSLGFALKSCPVHLDLFSFYVSGQGRRERTIEADRVCTDFRQHESKMDIVSLNRKTACCSRQRVWLNRCSNALAVCPWKM